MPKLIKEELGKDVDIVNSGIVVSKYLKRFLADKDLLASHGQGKYDTCPQQISVWQQRNHIKKIVIVDAVQPIEKNNKV